jgi:hypothetical protein
MGTISRETCKRYAVDSRKVKEEKMAFEEFRKGLLDGIYYRELQSPEYCGKLIFDAADLAKATKVDDIDPAKARMPVIQRVADSGGYSSITKAFIKPSIPFEIDFNSKPHKISVLTLMHPSPIRMENIQHDAMLTLGDPSEGNNDGLVILVPLVGSLTPGDSGAFIAKIARYMSGILTPNPATGQYEAVDIPTGSDWKLSSIFPGAPGEGGKTFVKSPGYYVWSGQPPLELTFDRKEVNNAKVGIWGLPDTDFYSWKPKGVAGIRYVMLSEPVQVSSMDLQTILMLPPTPITEAVSPIVKSTLTYRRAGSIGPNGTWVSECPARLPSLTNFFGGTRESMTDQCDPFAPGSFPSTAPTASSLVTIAIALVSTLGVFLAIYFAVKLWTQLKPGRWIADKGEWFGNMVAQFSISDARKRVAPAGVFKVSREEEKRMADEAAAAEKAEKKAAEEAEARLSAPAITPVTEEEKAVRRKKPKPAPEVKPEVKPEEPDMEKAIEASKKDAEAKAKQDAKDAADDAAEEAGWEAADRERERKRAAEEEVLRRNGPAGTGLDFTDEQLARNVDVERARLEAESLAPQGRPARRTRAQLTPAAGPSAIDRALAKQQEEAAKRNEEVKRQAEATKALFAEAKARKEEEDKKAAEAVEADIKKEKEKLEAEEEARIKALSEQAAASASDVATKTLKRRNIQSSDRDLAKLEAERKRQADELAQKDKEATRSTKPGAEGRESAGVPAPKGERPPTLPIVSQTKVTAKGETVKVEDPTNALGDYETAVKAYEDSTPATRDATMVRVRALEPRVRGISRNSPTLKSRYEALLQRAERATAAFKKEEDTVAKTRDSMYKKLTERETAVKKAVASVATLQMRNPTSIVLKEAEKKVQDALERLDAVINQVETGLKDIPEADRPLLKLQIGKLKTFSSKQREASNKNMTALAQMNFKGYKLEKGGRRKRMKRKSTRRYVA